MINFKKCKANTPIYIYIYIDCIFPRQVSLRNKKCFGK